MGAAQGKAGARPSAEQPGAELFGPVLVEPARRKNSMRQAVTEARRELALELPAVVRALAEQAKTGSVTHLKLFLELSGVLKGGLTVPEKKVRERTLEEILVQQWKRIRRWIRPNGPSAPNGIANARRRC